MRIPFARHNDPTAQLSHATNDAARGGKSAPSIQFQKATNEHGSSGMPGSNPAEQEIQTKATHALIAAIVGFMCCPLVDIYAIIAANQALRLIAQTGAGQQHSTLATIAKVIAIVHLCLAVLAIVGYIVMIVLVVATGVANQPG